MNGSALGLLISFGLAFLGPGQTPVAQEPRATLLESGQLRFVLYSDGTVIWRRGPIDDRPQYLAAKLAGDEFERWRSRLAPTASFMKLKKFYDLVPNLTDYPPVTICVNQGGEKCVMVVGFRSDRRKASAPPDFSRLYDAMTAFDRAGAANWRPEHLLVRIWPFDHAKEPALPWPANWPDLNDATTERHDQLYLLYFPADLEEPLKKFLAERGSTRPALINGRKWSVMYRYVFPGMSIWEQAGVRQQGKQ